MTTNPTLPQRRILECLRDGATIEASRSVQNKYVLIPSNGYPPDGYLPWMHTQIFCGLADNGWISPDDNQSPTVVFRITDLGRALVS
jgi:hypothetical protein